MLYRRVAVALSALLLAVPLVGCDQGGGPEASGATAKAPGVPAPTPLNLGGAVVIGASVSAGAEVTLPGLPPQMFGGDADLAGALAAATEGPTPTDLADIMFFMDANAKARKQAEEAKSRSPTFVFAVDYLFWHAYGSPLSDEARRALFDKGLERLGAFTCPVVVSDLPDMSHAIGKMLMKSQVPSGALLDELNARLDSWAKGKPNVVILHLRDTVKNAMAGGRVTLGGRTFEGPDARGLLVANGLHATADGLIAICLECLNDLKARGLLPPGAVWDHDANAIKDRLVKARLAAIAKKNEKAQGGSRPAAVSGSAAAPAGGR